MAGTALNWLARESVFVAVAKASGDLVIPDRFGTGGPTLFDRVRDELGASDLRLVHRLDRDTSGVILFARGIEAQRELSTAFEKGTVRKEYRALVDGHPSAQEGRIDLPLRAGRKGRMRVAEPGEGKPSATRWTLLESFPCHGWLAIFPETGRTHQIRVHLASQGLPIVGDRLYNRSGVNPVLDRLALHAFRIELELAGRPFRVEAPLPSDLAEGLERLRTA